MRARPLLLAVMALLAAGCGSRETSSDPAKESRLLSAHGISVALPPGWSGRILLGAEGRPVLHAANFDVPSTDTDWGQIARVIGGEMYVNVRNVGAGSSGAELPVELSASDFEGNGRLLEVRRDVSTVGERYGITAVSGRKPPVAKALAEASDLLGTLSIEPFETVSVLPLPADAPRIEGFGLSMRLPPGWTGRVARGEVEAMSPGRELRLRMLERGGTDAEPLEISFPFQLSTTEFVQEGGRTALALTGRAFFLSCRQSAFWGETDSIPPRSQVIEQANQALATLEVDPGDFYPGIVEPATFAPAKGWHTGTAGPAEVQPEGQQTWTYASTVPYVDAFAQLPPHKTLEQLPPDGIVISLYLFGPDAHRGDRAEPPFRLSQAESSGQWEGQIRDLPLYSIAGRVRGQRYGVNISVYFGRARPTAAQIAAANAELARLRLPDWSPTD